MIFVYAPQLPGTRSYTIPPLAKLFLVPTVSADCPDPAGVVEVLATANGNHF